MSKLVHGYNVIKTNSIQNPNCNYVHILLFAKVKVTRNYEVENEL